MKILIIGKAEHGKDFMAEILAEEFGVTFTSSSQKALDIFLYDKLKDEFGYTSKEECFLARRSSQEMRDRWKQEISDYNALDKARLAKGIFEDNDIYVGMRDKEELQESRKIGLIDCVVWVDASLRKGDTESVSSNELTPLDADFVIHNQGSKKEFKEFVIAFYQGLVRHNKLTQEQN